MNTTPTIPIKLINKPIAPQAIEFASKKTVLKVKLTAKGFLHYSNGIEGAFTVEELIRLTDGDGYSVFSEVSLLLHFSDVWGVDLEDYMSLDAILIFTPDGHITVGGSIYKPEILL